MLQAARSSRWPMNSALVSNGCGKSSRLAALNFDAIRTLLVRVVGMCSPYPHPPPVRYPMAKNELDAWNRGWADGVLAALTTLADMGEADSPEYREIVRACCKVEDLKASALRIGPNALTDSGLDKYLQSQPS